MEREKYCVFTLHINLSANKTDKIHRIQDGGSSPMWQFNDPHYAIQKFPLHCTNECIFVQYTNRLSNFETSTLSNQKPKIHIYFVLGIWWRLGLGFTGLISNIKFYMDCLTTPFRFPDG